MNKKSLTTLIAVAACNFELPVADGNTLKIQITPAGHFSALDGRPGIGQGWFIDAAIASRVIEKFNSRKSDVVIDYDHQTLHKEDNGQEAPAAAWFKSLEWVDGKGLYGIAELTQRAAPLVAGKEFRYFSPVFSYNKVTGAVDELLMGAITNTPAVDDLDELMLLAAASFDFTQPEEIPVNKLLLALIAAMGMSNDTTEDQAIAALNTRLAADPLKDLRTALGAAADADSETLVAACSSLKTQAAASNPDPAKFVPVAVVQNLQNEIAALNNRFKEADEKSLDTTIAGAIADGRIIGKEMEDWARDLGSKDIAALNRYLDSAKPVAALSKSQTNSQSRVDETTGLSDTELAVCNRMGISAEDYKKNKATA